MRYIKRRRSTNWSRDPVTISMVHQIIPNTFSKQNSSAFSLHSIRITASRIAHISSKWFVWARRTVEEPDHYLFCVVEIYIRTKQKFNHSCNYNFHWLLDSKAFVIVDIWIEDLLCRSAEWFEKGFGFEVVFDVFEAQ